MKKKSDFDKTLPGFEHVNRYWDARMNTVAAKIMPGECYVSSKGEMIVTVLGSCISACVRDKKIGIGGMNHFMLPFQNDGNSVSRQYLKSEELCYGNWAMEFLINEILKLGGRRGNLEVKLFGGARVLSGATNIDIGARNVQFALDFLEQDRLTIDSQDLGGDYPRKILYFPDTGAVKMKKMRTTENDTIERREREYLDSMSKPQPSGDVELF